MRKILPLLFCLCLGAAHASAQAFPAGRVGAWDASLGYSYLNRPVGESARASLNGFDAAVTLHLTSRFAARGDFGYAASGNLFDTSTHSAVLSYLAGPVFYPMIHRRWETYVQGLFGGARVSGPVPVASGVLVGGWEGHFAWAVGGGLDYRLSGAFALRAGADYVRTTYFAPSLALEGQSNIRATASIVCQLGSLRGRRR